MAAVGSPSAKGGTTSSRTVTVKRGVIQSTASGSGTLAAYRDQELAFSTAGTIKRVLVAANDHVEKSQVLARLKTSDGTIHRLRAPFTGTIASVDVAAGDTVGGTSSSSASGSTGASGAATSSSSDTTSAFELVSLKSYDMTVSLSESDVGKVKKGQVATVTVEATGEKLAARVKHVSLMPSSSSSSSGSTDSSSSSSSSVSYPVTLRLTQSSADLKPGMSASADIVTSETTGLTVPTAALRGNQVTVKRHGKRSVVQVQTGVAGDSTTQIVSGLTAGDSVVVTSTSATAGSTGRSSSSSSQQLPGNGGGFSGGPPSGGPPAGGLSAGGTGG